MEHMQALLQDTNGIIIINRDNFATRITDTVVQNLRLMEVDIGQERPGFTGQSYSIGRKLPMPNGGFADARLHIYTE